MARYYNVTFRHVDDGKELTIRGYGNTRVSAQRTARGRLKREHDANTLKWAIVDTEYTK